MDFPRKQHPPLKSKITNSNNRSYDSDIVEFQITDIFVPENDKYKERDNDELYTLLIFGTSEDGATFCVNVKNFCPFFYIKPPESWECFSDSSFQAKVDEFKDTLLTQKYTATYKTSQYEKKIIPKNLENHFKNISVESKKDFWGFTNNKIFKFLKIEVKSMKLYNTLKYYFKTLETS